MLEEESKSLDNTKALEKIINNDAIEDFDAQLRKNPKTVVQKSSKTLSVKNPSPIKNPSPVKSGSNSPIKSKIKLKRTYSHDRPDTSKKIKKFGKSGSGSWQQGK